MSNTYHGIVPYLFVDSAEAAIDWYVENFDFERFAAS